MFYGWVVVASAFLLNLSFGIFYSYGVFFTPLLKEFGWTTAATASVFSLSMTTFGLTSILAGYLSDRFGPRRVVGAGGLLLGGGVVLSSFTTSIGHLYATYGVVAAAGLGAIIVPSFSTTIRWFTKRRGLAVGIIGMGVGVGLLTTSLLAALLIEPYGWRVGLAAVGGVFLFIALFSAHLLKGKPEDLGLKPYGAEAETVPEEEGSFPAGAELVRLFRGRSFLLLYALFFLGSLAYSVAILYLIPYSVSLGIPPLIAAGSLSVVGVGSLMGRVGFGSISDYFGRTRTLALSSALEGVGLLMMFRAENLAVLYSSSLIFGVAYGGWIVVFLAVEGDFFIAPSLGVVTGVMETGFGLGSLTGPILAGYIIDVTGFYLPALIISSTATGGAAVLALVIGGRGRGGPRLLSKS